MQTSDDIRNTQPQSNAQLEINPGSFHVFEYEGTKLLFDLASCAICELGDVAFELLSQVENGRSLKDALKALRLGFEGIDETEVLVALQALQSRGFFRRNTVDETLQERIIAGLLRHKTRRIQLLVSQDCNLRCSYCYARRNGALKNGALMSWDVAKASVDYLVKQSAHRPDLHVTFFGGEPMLNYSLIQRVVAYCRDIENSLKKSFTFELCTNGTLLTQEVTHYLVQNRFLLFISIDGERNMHNANRPSKDGADLYDVILRNALFANKLYMQHRLVPIKARANMTKDYCDYFGVGAYLAALGFKVIGVGGIEPLPHGSGCSSTMTQEQVRSWTQRMDEVMVDAVRQLASGQRLDYFKADLFRKSILQVSPVYHMGITCGVCRNTQAIDTRGNIFPCHRYEGMEAYVVGNVLLGGHDRDKTSRFYHMACHNASGLCRECWIRDYCGGGCVWELSREDGCLVAPAEDNCRRRRASMERGIWMRQFLAKHRPDLLPKESRNAMERWDWKSAWEHNQAEETESSRNLKDDLNLCGGSSGSSPPPSL